MQATNAEKALKADRRHEHRDDETTTIHKFGRLNLNTCPKVAMFSIDASVNGVSLINEELLSRFDQYRATRIAQGEVPFRNTSDFLVRFFPKPTAGEVPALAKLLDQITVSSTSFEITSENRLSESSKDDTKRRQASARMKWVISLDQEPYSLVSFESQP